MYVLIAGGGKVGIEPRAHADPNGTRGDADRAARSTASTSSRPSSSTRCTRVTRPSSSCSSAPGSSARPTSSSRSPATTRTTSSSASSRASSTASQKVIARVNDPRNQPYFDLLGISPTVSRDRGDHGADRARGARARADPPARAQQGEPRDRRDHGGRDAPSAGKRDRAGRAPAGRAADLGRARRQGGDAGRRRRSSRPGDSVLAILEPGKEDELRRVLVGE